MSPCHVTSEVPQGLAHLNFMGLITKLPLSPHSKRILFTDDILLYKSVNSESDASVLQQDDINLLSSWIKSKGLTFNTTKAALLLAVLPACNPLPQSLSNPASHRWSLCQYSQLHQVRGCDSHFKPLLDNTYPEHD